MYMNVYMHFIQNLWVGNNFPFQRKNSKLNIGFDARNRCNRCYENEYGLCIGKLFIFVLLVADPANGWRMSQNRISVMFCLRKFKKKSETKDSKLKGNFHLFY